MGGFCCAGWAAGLGESATHGYDVCGMLFGTTVFWCERLGGVELCICLKVEVNIIGSVSEAWELWPHDFITF